MNNMQQVRKIVYGLLLGLLVLFTYGKVLDFTFWKDDWGYFWTLINHIPYRVFLLHPGTPLEFLLFIPLFGTNVIWWQAAGLVLKLTSAVAVFSMTDALTNSRRAGYIAGIVTATAVFGMDAVGWTSSHVLMLNVICLCFGFSFFIRALDEQGEKDRKAAVIWFLLALFVDPGRNSILFLLVLLYMVLFQKKLPGDKRVNVAAVTLVGLGGIACIVIIVGSLFVTGTPLGNFIIGNIQHPMRLLGKTYVVAKFFHTFGVMAVGWLSRIPEFDNTVEYQRILSRIGFLFIGLVGFLGWWKRHTGEGKIVLFCLGWMVLTYVPNWLFEPRLAIGVTHRYMLVSSVGFLILLSYAVSQLKYIWLTILCVIGFSVSNILMSHTVLISYEKERSRETTDAILSFMDAHTRKTSPMLVLVTGTHPIIHPALYYSMPAPLGIVEGKKTIKDLPLSIREFTGTNYDEVLSRICTIPVTREAFGRSVSYEQGIRLPDVYHFVITLDGSVIDQSIDTRRLLQAEGEKRGCTFKSGGV